MRTATRERAQEYLLDRSLFAGCRPARSSTSAGSAFSFPMRWHYDVLRALDYFAAAGAAADRPAGGSDRPVVQSRRAARRPMDAREHVPRAVHFDLEDGDGKPSRWNTLRALRVLDWWDGIA